MIEPTESRIFELDNKKYVIAGEIPIGGQARLFDVKTPQGEEAVLKLYVHDREMDSEKGFDRERIILEKAKKEERTDVPLILNSGRVDLGPLKVPAIVTKKIIGKTLEQVITRETNPTTEDVLILIKSVGNALKWAHAATKPIFHRDICPANIIFDEESENYKVMDWAAGRFGSGDTITNTQVYKSLYYTAPEVYNARKVMPAADIYSLSKTAMAYILGKDEFEGTFNGDPPIETFQRFNLPINLVNALFKAREEEPEKRYQSIDEFVKALNDKSDSAGEAYYKSLKANEDLESVEKIINYKKIVYPEDTQWNTKGDHNKAIREIAKSFRIEKIFHYLISNNNNESSEIIKRYKKEYLLERLIEYTNMSSSVHGGPFGELALYELQKDKSKLEATLNRFANESFMLHKSIVETTYLFASLMDETATKYHTDIVA